MSDAVSRLNSALEGRYHIERELGEGGMATVYLARDAKHNRNVALKVLKPELAAVIGAERFLAEIETTAGLQHPHILPLHDSGEADGLLFYVMPYVEGESLRERLDREHQLAVDEAIGITVKVAAALQAAHERGVIHRDIKPANILLSKGEPLISDFGIALAVSAGGAGRLTETGLSLGTPHYMSPEQATGDLSVGAATDVYALGCVLYEMLVGEPPYTGSTPQAILGKIIQADPVSATKTRRTVPAHVDAAISKALEKVPADRFSGAAELATALGDRGFRHGPLDEGQTAAGAAPPSSRWNRLTVGFASLAAVTTGIAGWSLLGPGPVEAPPRVERFQVHTFTGNTAGNPSLLPDGSGMVYGDGPLLLRRWSSLDPVPVQGTELALGRSMALSPAGDEVAFITRARELMVAPLAGGVVRTLAENAFCCMRWGSDDFLYYSPAPVRDIRRVPSRGGAVEVVAPRAGGGALGEFQVVPEAGIGLFTQWSGVGEIVAIRLATGERVTVTQGVRPYLTRTGHLVFGSADGQILAAPFDVSALELTGSPVPLVDGVFVGNGDYPIFSVADDGTLIYAEGSAVASAGLRLTVVDLDGNRQVLPLAPRDYGNFGPSWARDGRSVTFESEDQVYTYDVVLNTTPRQLTSTGSHLLPFFSPDGTQVAFAGGSPSTDGIDLLVKDLGDDSPPRPLLTLEGNQYPTQWVNDTLIAFSTSPAAAPFDLWTLDLSDPESPEAKPYLTSESDLRPLVVSPDGTLAAYSSNETGDFGLYLRTFPEPGERTVVSEGSSLVPHRMWWAPDGATLFHTAEDGGDWTIVAARLRLDPVPAVLSTDTLFTVRNLGPAPSGQALHPDGDRFIFAMAEDGSPDPGEEDAPPRRVILVQNFFEELRRLAPN